FIPPPPRPTLFPYTTLFRSRDILFVEDLVDAMLLAHRDIDRLSGKAFNIGGGARNTISLIELLDLIGELQGRRPDVAFEDWRTGDRKSTRLNSSHDQISYAV